MKTLQITRTATAALSLGTMDAVLRICLEYTQERILYGNPIFSLPPIRSALIQGNLDLLISESVAFPVSRALAVMPERLSLWSSVVKYLVPVIADETVARMATVLGARSFLCEGVAEGVFQKFQRDHAIASIFDGTTHVNLSWIAGQLPALAKRMDSPGEAVSGSSTGDLFDLSRPAPYWNPDGHRLRLSSGDGDEISGAWTVAVRALTEIAGGPGSPGAAAELLLLCSAIGELRESFYTSLAAGGLDPRSVSAHESAVKHCIFHAMSSCLLMWQHNRERFGGYYADGEWLVLCLQALLRRLEPSTRFESHYLDRFGDVITDCARAGAQFGLAYLGAINRETPSSAAGN